MDADVSNNKPMFRLDKWVNVYELAFDLAIAAATALIYRAAAPVTGLILVDNNPFQMIPVMAAAEFFIMLFFGQIYRAYNDEMLNPPRILSAFSDIVLFIAINGVFFLMPAMLASAVRSIPEIGENVEFAFVPLSGAFIILGITLGFPRKRLKEIEPLLSIPLAITPLLGVISLLFIIFTYGIIPGILYLIFVGGALLVNRLLIMSPEREKPIKPAPNIRPVRIIAGILLPIATALALIMWQEMVIVRAVHNSIAAGETLTPWNILVLLTIGGLLPVRLLAALAPPYKPVNTVVSIGAFIFYYTYLVSIIDKLTALATK
ncbi:MAG: hypothetical protein HPY53_16730 [Brevinematales bacterium]|nr:hypothetical protein [Brevinematales bacterium]